MMKPRNIFSYILSLVLRGTVLTVPLIVTIYALVSLVQFLDSLIPVESDIPGAGILVAAGILAFMGYLGSTYIAEPIIRWFQTLIDKTPLVKTVYSTVKDVLTALVGKKKAFTKPVRVQLMENGTLEKLGFVTEEDLSSLGVGNDMVAVYLPHSYAFSGNLFLVPKKNVTPVDANSSDVMKFIVSAGISGFESKENAVEP